MVNDETSELAASLKLIVKSIFITTLVVGKDKTNLGKESALQVSQEVSSP